MNTWNEQQIDTNYYQILTPTGELKDTPPDLSTPTLLRLYRTLLETRTFEKKTLKLQRRGDISIVSRSYGEEAIALGSAAALQSGDWCFPTYRQTAAFRYWDYPLDRTLAALLGTEPETIDTHLPLEDTPSVHFTPVYAPLAVNVANAVGSAMADTFTDSDAVSLAYIGDGSTSEGDFHEALNFAGVFEAPVVTICQNNQWANSVPRHKQTAAENYAIKAKAHGVPFERVDGNDILAVYDATTRAVERARSGGGPTFIECVSYRIGEHNTADDPRAYRSDTQQAQWLRKDPLRRFERFLCKRDLIDAELAATYQSNISQEIDAAVERALEIPRSNPQRMFDNHLHSSTWREQYQRSQLAAECNDKNPFKVSIDGSLTTSHIATETPPRPDLNADDAADVTQQQFVTAIKDTLHQEMHHDDSVRVLGYDIGPSGGVFRATEGLYDEFGQDRVIETPLSENAILGTAVGMALRGERPVPEIQFMGFLYPAFGQFMYTLIKMYERSAGSLSVPVTVRVPYGGGIKASEYHSESTESLLVHSPGIRVVCPSTPFDAKGLLAASIRSEDPVVFLEPKRYYRTVDGPVPDDSFTLPLDQARVLTRGDDVTVLTWGAMRASAEKATQSTSVDVEVIDLRSLSPLDIETILQSVRKTGRCVILHEARRRLGLGAELSALIAEHAVSSLRAPIQRATAYDTHVPSYQIENAYLPDAERVGAAIDAVMEYPE